ncbi:MAG: carboxymuconolactone decarboxylase family protein [Gammaproteobacteria bacterium]|nr:carboxymuconolactone decarboxylase family protein [Gammaproteobacteria bacterium]
MSKEMFDKGLQIRRELFGKDIGERHVREATDFTREFQEIVTRYCFGEVWGREHLPRRLRSMITLSMLIAQNRAPEIKLHLRTALTNGVTKDEIREILLNAMIYCGVPAAVDGFRCAREVFAEAGIAE